MNHTILARTAALLATLILAPSARAGELWRIGGAGAPPGALADALECARDGDVLLFAPGRHEVDALLGDRTLTLVGEEGARLRGTLTITGTDAEVGIRLVGLRLEALPFDGEAALHVHHFAGSVWLQDCELRGGDPYEAPYAPLAEAGEALRVVHAAEVVISGCRLYGGPAPPTEELGPPPTSGPAALHSIASRVALLGCTLHGGEGAADDYGRATYAGDGGPALFQRSGSRSFLWQSRLRGGDGGAGRFGPDGLGGTGLHSEGLSVDSRSLRVDGGSGSRPGLGVYQSGGSLRDRRAWPRGLAVTNPCLQGRSLTLMVRGVPGESVVLELAPESVWSERAVRTDSAPDLLGSRRREIPLGLIPISGVLLRRLSIGSLPPGTAATFFAQTRHDSGSNCVRGPALLLVVHDTGR